MKKTTACFALVVAGALLRFTPASLGQSTIVFSNLGQTPTGSLAVGNNAWCAEEFFTGTNSGGYLLDSIQLRLGTPTGTPSGFSLAIYDRNPPGGFVSPGSLLQNLTGPAPSGSGVFTFQSLGLILNPSKLYFVVATAATPISSGSYGWEISPWLQPPPGNLYWFPGSSLYQSTDGLTWTGTRPNNFMFAINATAVPEPSSLFLLGIGGSFLFTRLARKSRSKALRQP